jgi:hypothetical protein
MGRRAPVRCEGAVQGQDKVVPNDTCAWNLKGPWEELSPCEEGESCLEEARGRKKTAAVEFHWNEGTMRCGLSEVH